MTAQNSDLADLHRQLDEKQISGIWRIPPGARPGDPKTRVQPYLWKWADFYNGLLQARDQIDIERGTAERRTLRLVNPGVPESEMTSHTMLFAFQLIQPGEVAPPHRHTMAAIRFILQGKGGDTFVVPLWHWHEHANRSRSEEAILFSMNDGPVLKPFGLYREQKAGESHLGL